MEFCDNYCHLNPTIYYTPENIPYDDLEGEQIFSQIERCMCKREICDNNCTCVSAIQSTAELARSPYSFDTSKSELILSTAYADQDLPIYECNSLCKCGISCQNRLVQYGPRKSLKMHEYGSKGVGLFTKAAIPRGGFVCEYAGEIITKSEAAKRNRANEESDSMNYVICVNEHYGCNRIQTFVDPSEFGNIGRYLNHSCEPNCAMVPVRVDSPVPKLCLFATEDIKAGVELTFSYGLETNVADNHKRKECLCGSKNCSKWLPSSEYDS